ncbi:lipocalin-like protein [uncultured phage cr111_1]|uniref:Lipocalin-like protein n=1 Tax=uncultured phage cr111_1 TaxID=2772071 RepID=A0A7M1RY81_9CAUD|nr:lipocalin-like protein [uncultured phage cr111_1]QOR59124.1 lipocalin-like protein [uncultured phage cr111_1]
MADVTKNHIVVTPGSGSGNTTLQVKASPANMGNRVAQVANFTVTAPGVTPDKTFKATLAAAQEFVSFDNGTEMSVAKAGGSIVIEGTSNSDKLTFSKGAGAIVSADITKIAYKVNTSTNATSGTAITGDPGASAKFTFQLTLTATANTTTSERTQQITVTTTGNKTATITLKQSAGDAYLTVTPTEITVPQDGTAVQVEVNTNTTFTVS